MEVISGSAISAGFAVGKLHVFTHETTHVVYERCKEGEESNEFSRYEAACQCVEAEINELIRSKKEKSEIELLETQLLMVRDPDFTLSVRQYIEKDKCNAAWAVENAEREITSALLNLDSEILKDRIYDIQDIAARIIFSLTRSGRQRLEVTTPSIIVADTLLPFELLSLNRENILALCLESGGKTSHIAILSRSMGIPCIMEAKGAVDISVSGELGALDAEMGLFYADPTPSIIESIEEKQLLFEKRCKTLEETRMLPAITKDGYRVLLECNIEGSEAIEESLANGAEGVGLYRSEFLLMDPNCRADIEEHSEQAYTAVAKAFNRIGAVTIRTYDLGSDKVLGNEEKEDNPALGYRAIRGSLGDKELFLSQLRAILKASVFGEVRILFPLIATAEELDEALAILEEAKGQLRERNNAFDENIKVGIMIEVPSAAIISDILAAKVDFFSIGTNDLIQYTVAADRANDKVSYLFTPYHPAVLRLLKYTSDNASLNGIEAAVCGECAGDVKMIPLLIGLGFTSLSMSPSALLEARALIRSIDYSSAKALATKALNMTSLREIEKLAEDFHAETRNNK